MELSLCWCHFCWPPIYWGGDRYLNISTNKTIFLSMATRGKGWVDHFREISGSRTLSKREILPTMEKKKKNFWEFFTTSLLWNAIYARNILKYFGTLSMWSRLIRDVWRALREVKEGLWNKKSWERLQFIKVNVYLYCIPLGLCGDKWCFINVDVVIGCSILILFGFFFQLYITSFPAVVQYKTTVLDSRQ